jgi:GR25 family glycosyltransferase involved in LPS biosynthesis
MRTFVLHYQPLAERLVHMNKEIERTGLDAEFVLTHDKEVLTDDDKCIYDFDSTWSGRTLWQSNASLISKHLEAYTRILNQGLEYGHVLEDDVILHDGFAEKAQTYLDQLPHDDWDILFYGDGYRGNMKVPQRVIDAHGGGNVFLKGLQGTGVPERNATGWPVCGGASRCSDNYLISRRCVEKILDRVTQIRNGTKRRIDRPSDLWMNSLFRELRLSIYWGEPTLSTQGTETGMFPSAHKE